MVPATSRVALSGLALLLLLLECGVAQEEEEEPTVVVFLVPAGTNATDASGCPFTDDGECDEGSFCEEGTDEADCLVDAPSCPWINDGECDEGVFCAEDTDPADCALPDLEALEIDVSGTLFCETADFFNNSAVDECVVQPCCEWVDDRCQSAVGDESCDRGLWSEGAPPQQDSGDELEEFFEELFAAGDDDDDDDEEEEDDDDDDDADELTPAATAVSVPQGEAAAESDEDGRSSADDVFLPLISAAGVLLLGALLFVGRRAGWCSSVQNGGRKETEAVARDSTAETATLQGGGMKEDSSNDANP